MLTHWNDFGSLGLQRPWSSALAFDAFDGLRREMERLFSVYDRSPAIASLTAPPRVRWSLEDAGEALVVRAELPGVAEKDLELSVDAERITVKGERKEELPEGYSVRRRERGTYSFTRTIGLPVEVDVEKAEAVLEHGVLTITLPKAKEAQPRKIPVRTS
ncbi:MAG: Hsp20/alpha crystallin family protein [Pseudomonadota bacterium]|nr:MAG: Hsp20/alpha crystallin family protein [Pseudomonadota bacterium]